MRDHSDDWLREESDESIRISQLEDRVTELELLVEKLQSQLTQLAPDGAVCPAHQTYFEEDGTCAIAGCKETRPAGKA